MVQNNLNLTAVNRLFLLHYYFRAAPEMSLSRLVSFRYNHSADYDHPQQCGQDVATQSVLRHRHGPFRHRLLPVCLRCSDGVRNVKLLFVQHSETQLHAAKKIGEFFFFMYLS